MNVLVVDPNAVVGPVLKSVLDERGWTMSEVRRRSQVIGAFVENAPDLIVVHGDGPTGEAAHTCQWFKQNALTSGIPIILVEDAPPPAWLLAGLPADAIMQAPWDPDEFLHHVEILHPGQQGSGLLDDLTNLPRRRSMIDDLARRIAARELFGAGILTLREADAYRQDYGRNGVDQFVVLVSVLLRRHTQSSNPVSIGMLDDGSFLVIGPISTVHDVVAQTTYDFDALVPAYYEMDTLFGAEVSRDVGPSTWITLQGAVCLVEPDLYDNLLQVGARLADFLASGLEAIEAVAISAAKPASAGSHAL